MLNKKRLAMMAVAASMVLPNNLVYLATNTPVFAEETPTEEETVTEIKTVADLGDAVSGFIFLKGNYKLTDDIAVSDYLYIKDNDTATIDLNGHTLTSTSRFPIMIATNSSLTFENSSETQGEFTATASNLAQAISLNDNGAKLYVKSNVKLSETGPNSAGLINVVSDVTDTVVEIEDAVLDAVTGINVNGESSGAQIKVTNTTITATDCGIYQAGPSTITLNNPTITSDNCGIEIRAGELIINNGTIEGGTGTLSIAHNNSGSTTENAGLAIAQHTTDLPITVKVNGTTISGTAAVAITDPENNQADQQGQTDKDITIELSKAKLEGSEYNVAYTEDTIKFTLNDTPSTDVVKLASETEVVTTDDDGNPLDTPLLKKKLKTDPETSAPAEVKNPTTIPYEVTTTRVPSSGGGNKKPTKPVEPEPEEPMTPVATPTSMYRLYNRLTGEHLYTIDKNERDNLLTSDTWKDEGEGWIAPSVSDYPVYRLLNPNNGDHHYTTDKNEFDTLPSYGWIAEGVAFFSADKDNPENVLLHRLYNPNAEGAGSHHYTADTNERDALVAQGWKYEGLAWAGLPANK